MPRRLRAALATLLGLFVTDWTATLLALAILGAGWLLIRRLPGAPLGFAIAGALAVLIFTEAVLAARRLRGRG
jgi:hypothetical protein